MGAESLGIDELGFVDDAIDFLVAGDEAQVSGKGARLDVPDKEGRTPLAWAEGVFLATNSPVAKPSTMALIQRLIGQSKSSATPRVQP